MDEGGSNLVEVLLAIFIQIIKFPCREKRFPPQ